MSEDRPSAPPASAPPSLEHLRMLVPAYVLGALDASDRALFERGLATPAIARVLQGEIDVHRASLSTMLGATAAHATHAAPSVQTTTSATMPAPTRPSVRVDTSAYREGADGEGERPKRPTPMYGTAYRVDEWEPTEAPRANGRSYKPAKARRSREAERHADRHLERVDRATPRSVRIQPPPSTPSLVTATSADDDRIDVPSMEAAVDVLFSDAWSTTPESGAAVTPSVPAASTPILPTSAPLPSAPREPIVRRGTGAKGGKAKSARGAAAKAPASARRDSLDDADIDEVLDDAYEPRSRRGARGTPWAMITLATVALAAIGIAAWQGLRASRLQDRLLLQPALDAVGNSAVSDKPKVETTTPEVVNAAPVDAAPAVGATGAPDTVTPTAATTAPAAPAGDDRLASLFDARGGIDVVRFAATEPTSKAGAQLFWNVERGTGVIHAYGLAALAADRSYTLWMLQNGRPVSVTRFRSTEQGTALVPTIPMPSSRANVASFAVSVEPYSGSPSPTTRPILIGDVVTSNGRSPAPRPRR